VEFGPLSPELALVDPELGERARHALRLAAALPRTPPVEAPMDAGPPPRPARRHTALVRAAAALAVPSIILNVALLRPGAPVELRATTPVGGVAAASTTLLDTALPPDRAAEPRAAATSRKAEPARVAAAHRVLSWKRLPAARQYDVVIWRDGRRVRDIWTREPSVSVRSVACGTSAQLAKGSYLWFVYPVQSPAGTKHFGKLAHWGTFRVDDLACRQP
jgi:hypothetical protein